MQAGAARVGHEPVPLDHDRVLGLGDLDRDVRGEARRVREAVVAVGLRRAAPGADDELVEDEALAVGPLGAEDRERVAALAGGGTRSGSSWASAPLTASRTRNPVTPRIEEAPGITTSAIVPGLVRMWIGRKAPAVFGTSTVSAARTAW